MAAIDATAPLGTSAGLALAVRPLSPADRDGLAAAFARLSDRSRYSRFLGPKPRLSAAELTYLTDIDHRTHEALAAVHPDDGRIVAVARYAAAPGVADTADVAFFVDDAWQGRGIAGMLGARLVRHADAGGIERLTASTFAENRPARAVLRRLGFRTVGFSAGIVDLERLR
jgi:RimJ/RimL family protein N-acetyltransferase